MSRLARLHRESPRVVVALVGLAAAVSVSACGDAGASGERRTGVPGEPLAAQAQADSASDLLSIIGDSSAYLAFVGADPEAAAAIGLVNLAKDAFVIAMEGDTSPQTDPQVTAELAKMQSEIQALYQSYSKLDQLEQADAIALNFDDANGVRADLETVAEYLSSNIAQVLAHTASDATMQVLTQDVDWVENLVSDCESAIQNPVPGAYPVGAAYWFQTYEMALGLRVGLAVAGFPMDKNWVLGRYDNMHSSAGLPSTIGYGPLWSDPGNPTLWMKVVDNWAGIFWSLDEPYRAIRGAADFDHDGVADLVIHDPATGAVFATRMVPTSYPIDYRPPTGGLVQTIIKGFDTGWVSQGWVRSFGTIDPSAWHMNAIADMDGDGNPDLLFTAITDPAQMASGNPNITPLRVWYTNGTTVTRDVMLGPWAGNVYALGASGKPNQLLVVAWDFVSTLIAPDDFASAGWGASTLDYGFFPLPVPQPIPAGANLLGGYTAMASPLTSVDADDQPYLDAQWHMRGAADFNGDGIIDPLWYHGGDNDGAVQTWLSTPSGLSIPPGLGNGAASPVQPTTIGAQGKAGQDIRAAADFTGDGKPDLLWQDDGTNNLSVTVLSGIAYGGDARLVSVTPRPPSYEGPPLGGGGGLRL